MVLVMNLSGLEDLLNLNQFHVCPALHTLLGSNTSSQTQEALAVEIVAKAKRNLTLVLRSELGRRIFVQESSVGRVENHSIS